MTLFRRLFWPAVLIFSAFISVPVGIGLSRAARASLASQATASSDTAGRFLVTALSTNVACQHNIYSFYFSVINALSYPHLLVADANLVTYPTIASSASEAAPIPIAQAQVRRPAPFLIPDATI